MILGLGRRATRSIGRDQFDDVVPVLLLDMTGSRQLVEHPQLVSRHHRRGVERAAVRT